MDVLRNSFTNQKYFHIEFVFSILVIRDVIFVGLNSYIPCKEKNELNLWNQFSLHFQEAFINVFLYFTICVTT